VQLFQLLNCLRQRIVGSEFIFAVRVSEISARIYLPQVESFSPANCLVQYLTRVPLWFLCSSPSSPVEGAHKAGDVMSENKKKKRPWNDLQVWKYTVYSPFNNATLNSAKRRANKACRFTKKLPHAAPKKAEKSLRKSPPATREICFRRARLSIFLGTQYFLFRCIRAQFSLQGKQN